MVLGSMTCRLATGDVPTGYAVSYTKYCIIHFTQYMTYLYIYKTYYIRCVMYYVSYVMCCVLYIRSYSPIYSGLGFSPGKRERAGLDGWHADLSWGPGPITCHPSPQLRCVCHPSGPTAPIPDTESAGARQRAPDPDTESLGPDTDREQAAGPDTVFLKNSACMSLDADETVVMAVLFRWRKRTDEPESVRQWLLQMG